MQRKGGGMWCEPLYWGSSKLGYVLPYTRTQKWTITVWVWLCIPALLLLLPDRNSTKKWQWITGKKNIIYGFLQQIKFMQILPKFNILNNSVSAFAIIASLLEWGFSNIFFFFQKAKQHPNQQLWKSISIYKMAASPTSIWLLLTYRLGSSRFSREHVVLWYFLPNQWE